MEETSDNKTFTQDFNFRRNIWQERFLLVKLFLFRKDKSRILSLSNVFASFSVAGIYCMLRNCKVH